MICQTSGRAEPPEPPLNLLDRLSGNETVAVKAEWRLYVSDLRSLLIWFNQVEVATRTFDDQSVGVRLVVFNVKEPIVHER